MKNEELKQIMKDYINDYIQKFNDASLSKYVKGNIPIIWFGDIDAYANSKIRIVTVALNPSDHEFTETRFDTSIVLTPKKKFPIARLKKTLNGYYSFNPYNWFDQFQAALSPMNASYGGKYKKCENTAIHIDICTAIATDPVWTMLKNEKPNPQGNLVSYNLFKNLLKCLNPDIIIICCDKPTFNANFSHNRFAIDSSVHSSCDWNWKYEYLYRKSTDEEKGKFIKNEDKNNNNDQYIRVFQNTNNTKMLVWGRTANKPFGLFQIKNNENFDKVFIEIKDDYLQSMNDK